MELIDQAIHEHDVNGPPCDMWSHIAPISDQDNANDQMHGVQVERDIDQEDLDANAQLIETPNRPTSELLARYESIPDRQTLSPAEYRQMVRSLTEKQRQIVSYNRRWCKDAVIALKQNKRVRPYRIFLSGPGGVGKSHVIKLICSDIKKFLPLSTCVSPTDMTTLVTAPTGVAAFNIGGLTIHSALLLNTCKFGRNEALACDKLNTLRMKMEKLQL